LCMGHCAWDIVHCALCIVHCALGIVHCALGMGHGGMYLEKDLPIVALRAPDRS
jgi:hypothetical protein